MNRLACFGAVSCGSESKCPLLQECLQGYWNELGGVPLSVWKCVKDWRMLEYCRARVKTFAWECRVKTRTVVEK